MIWVHLNLSHSNLSCQINVFPDQRSKTFPGWPRKNRDLHHLIEALIEPPIKHIGNIIITLSSGPKIERGGKRNLSKFEGGWSPPPPRLKRSGQTISNTAAWKEGQKDKLKKRGGAAGKDEKKGEEKAGEARSTVGPASRALLSCLCTPQLADIILAALPGGVSAEVSTVTRLGPLSTPQPHLSGCFGTLTHRPASVPPQKKSLS